MKPSDPSRNVVVTFLWLGCFTLSALGQTILLANRKNIQVIDASGVGRKANVSSRVLVPNLEDAISVDYHFRRKLVCWGDRNLAMIGCARLEVSPSIGLTVVESFKVIPKKVAPDGIAVDWINDKIYWTDTEANTIEVCNLDGTKRRTLYWKNVRQARAIAVVPSEGLLFWTEWTEKAKIERAGMHGDDTSRLVLEEDRIFWPNALTIDYHSKLIYWADAKLQFIASMDYDGKRKRYFGEHKLKHPFAITFYRGKLFWSDWELSAVQTCDVASQCDKPRNLLSWKDPMDLQVWEQQPWSESPCHLRNGGCSDLCLAAPPPKRFFCACPTGVRMLNETTCDTGYKKFLVLARRPELRVISFDTAEKMSIVLPVSNLAAAKVVEFDPVEQRIYWIEGNFRSIRSASLEGGSEKYLTPSNLDMPEDIALDWVGRNLYWTDSGTKKISVTRLDGSTSIDLITTHLSDPRAVTLDVLGGWMFWSDWSEKPKIERAYMNGEARQLLTDSGLGWPGGITLDTSTQRVYWIDAKYDHLEVMNYDGTRRSVFITELPHPYSLTILGDFLYWTDWQRRSVEKADKASGKIRSVVLDQLPDVMGVKGFDMSSWSPSRTKCSRNNGGCSHFCLNRGNGLEPVCVCPPRYTLALNGVCSPPSAYLIYSCRYDIQTISLADFSHSIVPLSGIEDAGSLDYFYAEERIFWADTKIGAISRAYFNGSDSRRIVEVGVKYLEGMAVDWISQNIYWADLGSHRIEMARLDGSSRKVLIWKDIESPRSLAVNPLHGYLYWSEWSEHKPRIERATLDGAKRTTIVDNVGRSNGLTVNYEERRLYWTDVDGKQIESADLDGRNRRTILAEGLTQPFGMTMFGNYLYWTDIEKDSVERASKDGSRRLTVKSNLTYPLDILVYHPTRQQGTNACAFDDGECSHLCVPEPRDSLEASDEPLERVCTCPTHYKLAQPGGTKCQGPSSFLLFSQTDRISRLVMDTDDCPDIILPIRALEDVMAIAYDQRAKLVYWIDGNSSTIRYSAEDDTHGKDFLVDSYMYEPFDVVYEPLTDLVFWSCSRRDVINVTRASDRRPIGIIVGESDGYVQKPRSLAVHSARGLLFWTDLAAPGFIRRCNLDGSNGSIVVKEDLHQPTAMTVDQRDDLIFWADSEQRRIEMATIDGHNRAVLVGQGIFAPQSLAVLGDYLYWIDSDEQNLERVHKTSSDKDESVAVLSRLSDLTDIVSVELLPQKLLDASPCRTGMNRCSHLCLVDFNFAAEFVRGTETVTKKRLFWNHRCACPRGLMLDSNGFTCVRVVPCRADYFACSSGDCVPQARRCDGKNDCPDGSDESSCSECEGDWFRCQDGTCLDPDVVCDELSDCADGSDEGPEACEAKNPLVNPLPPVSSGGIPAGATPAAAAIPPAPGSSKSPLFTIVICICIVVLISVFILAYYCRRNSTNGATPARQEGTNGGTVLGATTGVPVAAGFDLRSSGTGRSQTSLNSCVTYSVLLRNSNGTGVGAVSAAAAAATAPSTSSYDRNHVTGASSSSSSGGAVAPSGPPPSPASAVKLPYHSRALLGRRNRGDSVVPVVGPPPPPTTPCTTDACDESDCTVGKYYELDPPPPTPARWHGHGHGHGHGHHGHGMGLSDASDCPPSPATERSFFNPQPPPPSPEPSSQQPFLPRS